MHDEPIRFFSLKRPHRANREFVAGCVKHVLGARFHLTGAHKAPANHAVGADFVGIAVASAPDPATDDHVLEALKALGIRRLRLDYGYESPNDHTERFLGRALEESFEVLLHLVQPFEEARRMPAPDALERWRGFVTDTLARWGKHLDMVEVGSTINRKRWAGYEVEGWLATWETAHEQVRRHDLLLVGPNITDFEPIYNEALLGMLRRRKLLPDVHSNNLFAERAIEPEAWDHKILGRFMAPALKANVVRKARILQRTGARYGIARTWSTNAFWTLPRIRRILADGEAKHADYLVRYLVLTAASGALEHVYWGPLISQREGLIDDGTDHYPALDQVTWYGRTFGDPSRYRKRPAFHAMAQFQRTIAGLHYLGPGATAAGLEIHRFRGPEGEIHVAWTMNARCADLASVYAPADLERVRVFHRDGAATDALPDLITESPLYLHWPDGGDIAVRPDAGVLPRLSIHAHRNDGRHVYVRNNGWRGMVVAETPEKAGLLLEALHPERIGGPDRKQSLRLARNAIWKVPDPRDSSRYLVVKQPARMRWHKRILDRRNPSKARRSWNGACELLRRGIPTPMPLGWFERDGETDLMRNWYICEHADNSHSVRRIFTAFARGETTYEGIEAEDFYRRLSDFLLDMHKRGVFFRDLSGGNILVHLDGRGGVSFSLIDTARARFTNTSATLLQRLSDLRRTCHKLHWPGRMRFMEMYLGALGKSFTRLYRLYFTLYDLRADWKRLFRR